MMTKTCSLTVLVKGNEKCHQEKITEKLYNVDPIAVRTV